VESASTVASSKGTRPFGSLPKGEKEIEKKKIEMKS